MAKLANVFNWIMVAEKEIIYKLLYSKYVFLGEFNV